MKKDKLFVVVFLVLIAWVTIIYYLFSHKPNINADSNSSKIYQDFKSIQKRVDKFESRLKLVNSLTKSIQESIDRLINGPDKPEDKKPSKTKSGSDHKPEQTVKPVPVPDLANDVIPVLMMACNRVTVKTALDSLLNIRKDKNKFPVIVSQVNKLYVSSTHLNNIFRK